MLYISNYADKILASSKIKVDRKRTVERVEPARFDTQNQHSKNQNEQSKNQNEQSFSEVLHKEIQKFKTK